MSHDISKDWIPVGEVKPLIEQEYDGMEAIDGYSNPITDIDWECTAAQPDFVNLDVIQVLIAKEKM